MTTRAERAQLLARKERAHETYVIRTYGLAPGEYQRRLAEQGNRCAICGKTPRKRYLAVDHDHRTGRVRGLLCYLCNHYLGQYEHDPATTARAIIYLQRILTDHAVRLALVEPGEKD